MSSFIPLWLAVAFFWLARVGEVQGTTVTPYLEQVSPSPTIPIIFMGAYESSLSSLTGISQASHTPFLLHVSALTASLYLPNNLLCRTM
jgi:hypothetical protein